MLLKNVLTLAGVSYSRVHTQGTVVGRQRDEMSQRVANKLKVMRKNSIRFSRGMVRLG